MLVVLKLIFHGIRLELKGAFFFFKEKHCIFIRSSSVPVKSYVHNLRERKIHRPTHLGGAHADLTDVSSIQ